MFPCRRSASIAISSRSFAFLIAFGLSSAAAFAQIANPVTISTGQIAGAEGKNHPEVRAFKGIPYAAPPLGELRWKTPQPPAKWTGVRQATEFGPSCTANGGGRGGANSSEDCMYVNVWTGAKSADERRPVIVWTYGGGFTGGSSSTPNYDGEALAAKGAVVVSYNYRLGVFGFLAHPELTKESSRKVSGNQGMYDMHTVLEWVQENIAAFGGDPNRVTIDGESAGSILVGAMMGSPRGAGLFHRAMGQSAGYMGMNMGRQRTREEAEAAAVKAAGGKSLAELRALPTQEAAAALRGSPVGLIVDGWMIPEDLSLIYTEGKQNQVDVLLGSNSDEGTFAGFGAIESAEKFHADARAKYGNLAGEFQARYPAGSEEQAKASALTRFRDETAWVMRVWAKAAQEGGKSAYVYYFTRVRPGNEAQGATHVAEIPYMFGNPAANGWNDTDAALSDKMMTYWVNFAATGNPNGNGLPLWPRFDAAKNDGQAMVFGDTVGFGPQIGAERFDFFDRAYARFVKELE